ncbi:MAG: hypothetical protein CSA95_01725 [Bacteroidetes bacterium]|nr:MAG: hypothetical protein CSA95_01725 [Bacteroidota bacterium]
MNILKTLILLALSLFLSLSEISAQKEWSLEECIDYALEHNIQVKQRLLTMESREVALFQSKMDLIPSLDLGGSHGYNWGQTVDLYTNNFATDRVQSNNFYASSNVILFAGFQKINTIKRNQIELLRSRYDTDQFMDDISLNIATAYLEVLYYREMLAIYEAQEAVTAQQVAQTAKLVEAGVLARGDLLSMEAQAANEALQLTNTRNALDLALLTLAQLLDFPDANDFTIRFPSLRLKEELPVTFTPEQIYLAALQTRADIKREELAMESSLKTLGIAKGSMTPSLSLSGSWGTGYSGAAQEVIGISAPHLGSVPVGATANGVPVFDYTAEVTYGRKPWGDQLKNNSNQTLTASINIPIFNGYRARTAIANARIGVENARLDLEVTKQRLRKTIQQAYSDALASLKSYQSGERKLVANQEAFLYAQEKLNAGLINALEYNTTKKDRDQAHSEVLQAKYDFIFKSVILEFYMGNPLSLKPWQE